LAKNYNKIQIEIPLIKKKYKIIFFNIFLLISSTPFAKIMEVGNKIKIISEPFFSGIQNKKVSKIIKFVIIKIQFLRNVLFTDSALIDLKKIDKVVKIKILQKTQKNFDCV
tara:strand:- start:85 stop:417 length:333 start_codon:yes stop_codon:yes gene_type:complete